MERRALEAEVQVSLIPWILLICIGDGRQSPSTECRSIITILLDI